MTVHVDRLLETRTGEDRSQAAIDFINAVTDLCVARGFAIGHSDGEGTFQVYPLPSGPLEDNLDWFIEADEVRFLKFPPKPDHKPDEAPFRYDTGTPV